MSYFGDKVRIQRSPLHLFFKCLLPLHVQYPPIMAFIVKTFLAGIWLKTLSASSVLPHLAHCQQGYSNPGGIILWTRRPSSRSPAYCQQGHTGFQGALASQGKDLPSVTEHFAGQKRIVEKLWRDFFSDPSQWWDHRLEKENPRFPDFKHKKRKDALWLNGKLSPSWVRAELAAMRPGTVQLSIFSWNARLSRYAKAGQFEKVIKLFQQMELEGTDPDRFTFVPVLNACASLGSLQEGRRIHRHIIERGFEQDAYVGGSLVGMYVKCGSIEDALTVFNKMPSRSRVSWNVMIMGLLKTGHSQQAFDLCHQMQQEGVELDPITFVGFLNACGNVMDLNEGRRVHEQIIQRGYESDIFVGSSLVDMYAKCGSIEDAWSAFNNMPSRDVVAWSAMIHGYVKAGQGCKALELFQRLQEEKVEPDPLIFVGILNACTMVGALEEGRSVHKEIIDKGWESNVSLSTSLVEMYGKCGSIEDAQKVFDKMPMHNVVSWNAMIQGYLKCGQAYKALKLSLQMQQEGVEPNAFTFVGFLKACAHVGALEDGKRFHEEIRQRGFHTDVFVGSSLVDMYCKCGRVEDAEREFEGMPKRNVITWNAMVHGYVRCGQCHKAMELFTQMQHEGVDPDRTTFVGFLNACASVGALDKGRHLHEQAIQRGYDSDLFVGSSLVDMYGKCGSIEDAQVVFNKMPTHDVISWNAMIHGYVKCGQGHKALELLQQMESEGIKPDPVSFVHFLNASASMGSLEAGRRLHQLIIQRGFDTDIFVSSSLVDMYSKCGSIEDGRRVFNNMSRRDVVAWSSMIQGYVKCGLGQRALELSDQMQNEGVQPNPVTFVSLLNACTSVGSLEQGRLIHEQIIQRNCESDGFVGSSLIDMYTKCGSVQDAQKVFDDMPTRNVAVWNAMIHGYVRSSQGLQALELGQQMQLEGVQPNVDTFVGLLNACASKESLEKGRMLHEQIIEAGFEADVFIESSLIDMYMKCRSLEDAQRVFNKKAMHDVISWNALILGHVKSGHSKEALILWQQMQREGVQADSVTFLGLLNACASLGAIEEGMCIHKEIIERGCESDVFVGSSLVDMYAKCGSIEDAWRVFTRMSTSDVVPWTAMLGGYAMHGHSKEALRLFDQMCHRGIGFNRVTLVSLLCACSHGGLVDEGLHFFELMGSGYSIPGTIDHSACMVDLLGRAGRLHEADDLLKAATYEPHASAWMSLLGACRVHSNVEMGERIAVQGLDLDPGSSTGFVLLSNIYAAASKWHSYDDVQQLRQDIGVKTIRAHLD